MKCAAETASRGGSAPSCSSSQPLPWRLASVTPSAATRDPEKGACRGQTLSGGQPCDLGVGLFLAQAQTSVLFAGDPVIENGPQPPATRFKNLYEQRGLTDLHASSNSCHGVRQTIISLAIIGWNRSSSLRSASPVLTKKAPSSTPSTLTHLTFFLGFVAPNEHILIHVLFMENTMGFIPITLTLNSVTVGSRANAFIARAFHILVRDLMRPV